MKHFLLFTLFFFFTFFCMHGQIMITELADPADNSSDGRFVELYNYSAGTVDLGGWSLTSWTGSSGNTYTKSLSGSLNSGEIYVVAESSSGFTSIYGQSPDLSGGSTVDRDGDDGFILFNGTTIIDAYGTFTESNGVFTYDNGDNTCWEYTDGRAYRKITVTAANPNFDDNEWVVFNDLNRGITGCSDYFSGTEYTKNIADMGPYALGETLSKIKNTQVFITLSPNPVSDGTTYLKGLPEAVSVRLYSLSGQLVHRQITPEVVDVSGLNRGLYLLRIDHKDWAFTRKLVIE